MYVSMHALLDPRTYILPFLHTTRILQLEFVKLERELLTRGLQYL